MSKVIPVSYTHLKKEGKATGLIQDRIPGYNLAQLAAYPMVNPLWTKDTARSTASKLVFNYMGAKGDGILNIREESTLFTNIAIPTDWNQTQMLSLIHICNKRQEAANERAD